MTPLALLLSLLAAVAGSAVGPAPALGGALGIVAFVFAIANPRKFTLWVMPFAVLVPPTVRFGGSGIPLTALRVVLVAAVIGWLLNRTEADNKLPERWWIIAVVFTAFVFVDALSKGNAAVSRGMDYSIEVFGVVWVVNRAIRGIADAWEVVDALTIMMALASLLAIYERLTGRYLLAADPPYIYHAPTRLGGLRAQGIFPHPLVYAAAVAIVLPLTIARAVDAPSKRLPYMGMAAIMVMGLIYAEGRGPWGAALAGIVVFVALQRPGRRMKLLAGLFCALVAIGLSPVGGRIGTLVEGVFNAQSGQQAGVYTVEYRKALLQQSIDYTESHPFGTGPGLSGTVTFLAVLGTPGEKATDLANSIDNAFAKYGVELGWVGLLLFVGVLVAAITAPIRARRSEETTVLASAVIASIVAMIVVSFTVASFSWEQLATMFWVIVGLGFACRSISENARELESAALP